MCAQAPSCCEVKVLLIYPGTAGVLQTRGRGLGAVLRKIHQDALWLARLWLAPDRATPSNRQLLQVMQHAMLTLAHSILLSNSSLLSPNQSLAALYAQESSLSTHSPAATIAPPNAFPP